MNDLVERVRGGLLAVQPAGAHYDLDDVYAGLLARAAIETVFAALKEPAHSVIAAGFEAGLEGKIGAGYRAMLAQAEKEFLGDG